MWQLIRPLEVSTSVNLARGGGGWCSAAREKLVNKVSWDRTERSVGKNCINWFGRSQRGQNALFAGSSTLDPQVVMASFPPGRTKCHSSRTALDMSGTKKIPKTHMTASKLSPG